MNITLRGTDYYLTFQYKVENLKFGQRNVTYALLRINGENVKSGVAIQNPNDTFIRSVGRKIAIKKMLDTLEINSKKLTKEERKNVWEQYLSISK